MSTLFVPATIDSPELTVVLPTRNERKTIALCIERLEAALGTLAAEVIFVDDSDDGTDTAIATSLSRLPITLIHRAAADRDGGLATAVLSGMRAARGNFICVLDADMQHPPEKIYELMQAIEAGADVVIASRYVRGGSAHGLGSMWRVAASNLCRRLAQVLFRTRLSRITDPLSGFFVVRRQVLADAVLRPLGFKILLEILIRGTWSNLTEVPYVFEHRSHGVSKATMKQGWLYLQHLRRLRGDQLSGQIARLQVDIVPFEAVPVDERMGRRP